jgi:hypothetical protein
MKFYLSFSHANAYIAVLEKLASLFPEEEKLGKKHELIPFVLTCAAALECMLNDAIIEHTSHIFGLENYRRFADTLITIPLRGKLDYIIPLASNYKFLIRQESATYQQLASLISIRNKLTHNKTFPYELETEEPEKIMEMALPRKFEEQLEPNINVDYCYSSLRALKNLAKILNIKSRAFKGWKENDTIVKNKNH